MNSTRRIFAIAAAAALVAPGGAAMAGTNITLCGASPGGLWSLLGAGLDAAVRKVDPESTVTYQTSSGGFANIVQLREHKCDLAIVHIGEVTIAARGEEPFKEPTGGIAAVSLLYSWAPMQWVIGKEYAEENKLSSIADLAALQNSFDLVVNKRGILPSILAEKSLDAAGTTFAQLEERGGSIQYQGSQTAAEIMQDGKADAWVNATFIGDGAIKSISESRALTLLSVPADVIKVMEESYGSKAFTIPAGAYDWLDHDIETFAAQAALVASDDADPAIITLVSKAIFEHTDEIKNVHKAMAAFDGAVAASITELPYHPAAAEVIKAAGF